MNNILKTKRKGEGEGGRDEKKKEGEKRGEKRKSNLGLFGWFLLKLLEVLCRGGII